MVGTWDVRQRMWPAATADAIELPAAVARRRFAGDAFIEEVMEQAGGAKAESFTRVA
jgi:hypothetical protein